MFSRFKSGSKGTIRLTDIVGRIGDTPVGALSAVMLYRANCRLVTGDKPGAIVELRESIDAMPGDGTAGLVTDELDTGDAELNWQNHLAYLRLAELLEDEAEREDAYREAYTRFPWLAEAHFGASVAEIGRLDKEALRANAVRILAHNRKHPKLNAGPHEGLRMIASPIWTSGEDNSSVRVLSLVPAGFTEFYYGEKLDDDATAELVASIAAEVVGRYASNPWRLASMTEGARGMYGDSSSGAPIAEQIGKHNVSNMVLSAVMAEAARYVHAGATAEEMRIAFGLDAIQESASLEQKLAAVEEWETQQYMQSMGAP
ncbi:MAG: hypothetical protein GY811_26000 [Myxococcales bacterium]|nr:hypothetical protein [Myxococcales bacterium]